MTRLQERIETTLPLEDTFAFVADFANAERWDPGVVSSLRLDDGPLRPGASYRLQVRMGRRVAPMTYHVVAFDPPHRVVLVGAGSGVDAVDEIAFERTAAGTRIDYRADIQLRGPLRLVQPFLGGALGGIARDAATGMRATLAKLAASGTEAPS